MHLDYRYMLIMMTYRNQKTFNVPIIKCVNSIAYIQRQIDKILRRVRKVKTYVNDIVIDAIILREHLKDFKKLF